MKIVVGIICLFGFIVTTPAIDSLIGNPSKSLFFSAVLWVIISGFFNEEISELLTTKQGGTNND